MNDSISAFQHVSFSAFAPITLTDSPAVVELKREFRALDDQEESLKAELHLARPSCREASEQELIRVRARKQLIATEIFGGGANEPS